MSPGGQPLADFGTRLRAYMIDGAIAGAVWTVIAVPVLAILMFRVTSIEYIPDGAAFVSDVLWPLLLVWVGLLLLMLALYYFYYVEMMFRSGQSVGKRAMKIRVVPLDPDTSFTRGMATKRYAVHIIAGTFVPLFSWLDGLWQIWDQPYLQTLHDKAAQTVVIKVSP